MAKNNYNYFTQGIDKYGTDDFFIYKNSPDIERDVPNILRQLAKRRIDLDIYGHYFLSKPLMDAVLHVSLDKIRYHSTHAANARYRNFSDQYYGYPPDEYNLKLERDDTSSARAYQKVYLFFMQAKKDNSLNPIIALADEFQRDITLANSL